MGVEMAMEDVKKTATEITAKKGGTVQLGESIVKKHIIASGKSLMRTSVNQI